MKSNNAKAAAEIIESVSSGNFYCVCPCGCGEEIRLKDADLFYLDDFSESGKEARQELLDDLKQQRAERERVNTRFDEELKRLDQLWAAPAGG